MTKAEYLTWLALWGEAKELQTTSAFARGQSGAAVDVDSHRACKFCAAGAIRKGPGIYRLQAHQLLQEKIGGVIWLWNDRKTFASRRAVFRALVAELESTL